VSWNWLLRIEVEVPPIGSRDEALARLVEEIRGVLDAHGFDWADLRLLLARDSLERESSQQRMLAAAKAVVVAGRVPADRVGFRLFVECLSELLDEELPLQVFDDVLVKVVKGVRWVLSSSLLVFVCYIVGVGLMSDYGGFSGLPPAGRVGLLLLLMVILAGFEGLQISVTTLRLKDLEVFRSRLPRAFQLHKRFRSEEGARRFLAGRQLFVVVVVFLAARLTSFDGMPSLPGLSFVSSESMRWFRLVFFDYGVAGALLVLWVGQLAPQFLANKHPHGFLNFPGMRWVLGLSFFVEGLGLTRPGEWIAAPGKKEEEIPLSRQERYRQAVRHVQGYGVLGIKKLWRIEPDSVQLTYQASRVFFRSTLDSIVDDGLELRGEGVRPECHYRLFRRASSEDVDLYVSKVDEERLGDGWKKFEQVVEPHSGGFVEGDVLLVETLVDFDSASGDGIHVTRPTKFIIFRAVFGDFETVGDGQVRVFAKSPGSTALEEIGQEALPVVRDADGNVFIEYVEAYPPLNRYYLFTWDVG